MFGMGRIIDSLKSLEADHSLKGEADEARKAQAAGQEVPPYISQRYMTPQPLPPEKFIEMAQKAIAMTQEGLREVPALQQEVLRLKQQSDLADNALRKAEEELDEMKTQRSRGVAKAWVMRNCKFARNN